MERKTAPTYFKNSVLFRRWLEKHHESSNELWVGFYKKGSGKPSLTWPESVEQALCFGWIDGIRKSVDENAYTIRFTPRKTGSHWSNINISTMEQLIRSGLVWPAGMEAYLRKKEMRSGRAAHEQKEVILPEPYEKLIRNNKKAWGFFNALAPSYKKNSVWWVISAKREETRLKRLEVLIGSSAAGLKIPPLRNS